MSRRLRLLIVAIGIFLAACTSEGTPGSFQDQNNRAERQFISSCEAAQEGDEQASEFCQCAFYTAAAELGFEGFLELDEQLQDDPASLSLEQRALFGGDDPNFLPCQFSREDIPN